jgi:MOSC domain-containing protein YiiM
MNDAYVDGIVEAVSLGAKHAFSKQLQPEIVLIAGIGVAGDAHAGATVQHVAAKRRSATAPNLRQVHLLNAEVLDRLHARGYDIAAGALGENITVRGIDLLALGAETILAIGEARLLITGTRTPCYQIDRFRRGLQAELTVEKSTKRFLSGVMSVVLGGGTVRPGDAITVIPNPGPYRALRPV